MIQSLNLKPLTEKFKETFGKSSFPRTQKKIEKIILVEQRVNPLPKVAKFFC